jgi:hypothetical protein
MGECVKLREHWNMASCNKERCSNFGYCVRMVDNPEILPILKGLATEGMCHIEKSNIKIISTN